jgi:hypothetical protein
MHLLPRTGLLLPFCICLISIRFVCMSLGLIFSLVHQDRERDVIQSRVYTRSYHGSLAYSDDIRQLHLIGELI